MQQSSSEPRGPRVRRSLGIAVPAVALVAAVAMTGESAAVLAVAGLVVLLAGLAILMGGAQARARRGAVAVLAVAGAGMFLGGTAFAAPGPVFSRAALGSDAVTLQPRTVPTPSAAPALLATTALADLTVKGPSPMTGYKRVAEFGQPWEDVNHNGCSTREDVLLRDLTATTTRACKVMSGTLHDPYTGGTIHFVRGERTSEAVQIDHVVSLGDAWRTGAQALTQTQRIALANDPVNLFAVDGPTNTRKSDGDTATWLPPRKPFRCTYVAHQIAVKRAYHLWVTKAERAAMARVLTTCPTQTLVTDGSAEAVVSHGTGGVVHPGAICSTEGATGRTAKGTAMACRTSATDQRDRWRKAA